MKYAALWLGEKYQFGFINEEGRFEYESSLNDSGFAVIRDKDFENLKKVNIPNLGYNKLENGGYEIFDKSIQEYDEYEVPVLVRVLNNITQTENKTLLSIPTHNTISAANLMEEKVRNELFKFDYMDEITKLHEKIVEENGIALVTDEECSSIRQIFGHDIEGIERLFEFQECYVVGIIQNDPNKVLTLNVPKWLVAPIIGTRAHNVKEMARRLGVKRIEVKALQD